MENEHWYLAPQTQVLTTNPDVKEQSALVRARHNLPDKPKCFFKNDYDLSGETLWVMTYSNMLFFEGRKK